MSVVEVDHLTKDYGSGRGVFDVSFQLNEGEVFGFLGPNGAGKSTTIRHIMGFSRPDSGCTKLFGRESFGHYHEVLNRVGYIPGEIALPAGLTGWEFIRMMQDLQGCHDNNRLNELLNLFELDPSGETKRMSLGVKRKLAVVTAFMHDPDVLILDEPTSGLDPVMQETFVDYVRLQKSRGRTILLSSHIFSEVDATCDRIAIIKDGSIVSEFVADELRHASRKSYRITFSSSKESAHFLRHCETDPQIQPLGNATEDCSVIVSVEDRDINHLVELMTGYSITGFTHLKQTLEDYFMSYYKEDKSFGGVLTR